MSFDSDSTTNIPTESVIQPIDSTYYPREDDYDPITSLFFPKHASQPNLSRKKSSDDFPKIPHQHASKQFPKTFQENQNIIKNYDVNYSTKDKQTNPYITKTAESEPETKNHHHDVITEPKIIPRLYINTLNTQDSSNTDTVNTPEERDGKLKDVDNLRSSTSSSSVKDRLSQSSGGTPSRPSIAIVVKDSRISTYNTQPQIHDILPQINSEEELNLEGKLSISSEDHTNKPASRVVSIQTRKSFFGTGSRKSNLDVDMETLHIRASKLKLWSKAVEHPNFTETVTEWRFIMRMVQLNFSIGNNIPLIIYVYID
jgi:hypothetical protein